MSLWIVVGFLWLGACILLAVLGMEKGWPRMAWWLTFGVALFIFHRQMNDVHEIMGPGMERFNWVIKLFSILMLIWAWVYGLWQMLKANEPDIPKAS